PILNRWHPGTSRVTYWFPTLFMLGLLASIAALFLGVWIPALAYLAYFLLLFVHAWKSDGDIRVAFLALYAALTQFTGYGYGFLKSSILLTFSRKEPQELFPKLFFKKN